MSIFIEDSILGLIILILALFLPKTEPNLFFGVRTGAALSDREVWKKTNRVGAIILSLISLVFILLNFTFYLLGLPESYVNYSISFLVSSLVASVFYLDYYSKRLLKLKGGKEIEIEIPSSFVYAMLIASTLLIVFGVYGFFSLPNSWIGIRIEKTLKDVYIWRRVNQFGGVGYTVLGLIFLLRFIKDLRWKDNKRTIKDVYLFLSFLILWSVVSLIYAYLI